METGGEGGEGGRGGRREDRVDSWSTVPAGLPKYMTQSHSMYIMLSSSIAH